MTGRWYYTDRDGQHGPVSSDQLKTLAEAGQLDRFTSMVWKEGWPEWKKVASVKGLFQDSLPPPLPVVSIKSDNQQIMSKWIYFWVILASGLIGFTVSRIGYDLLILDQRPVYHYSRDYSNSDSPYSYGDSRSTLVGYKFDENYVITMAIGNLIAIPCSVFLIIFVYKKWKYLVAHPLYQHVDVSAASAIGFMCIPFFNFYWNFVVFVRFVRRLNDLIAKTGSSAPPISEGLAISVALVFFVLAPISFYVPVFGDAVLLAGLVLLLIYVYKVPRSINALYRDTMTS